MDLEIRRPSPKPKPPLRVEDVELGAMFQETCRIFDPGNPNGHDRETERGGVYILVSHEPQHNGKLKALFLFKKAYEGDDVDNYAWRFDPYDIDPKREVLRVFAINKMVVTPIADYRKDQ